MIDRLRITLLTCATLLMITSTIAQATCPLGTTNFACCYKPIAFPGSPYSRIGGGCGYTRAGSVVSCQAIPGYPSGVRTEWKKSSCDHLNPPHPKPQSLKKIKNKAWGKCLNLQKNANKDGGLPNVWGCTSHPDQEWEIENIGGGYAKIKNKAWGKCLNLQKNANKDGGLPNVWGCTSHSDQEWMIYDK